jgi:hypothetical protein
MPKNTTTGKREKGAIAGYVRFALTESEMELLDEACKLEEHCRSDLARLYTMRLSKAIVSQDRNYRVISGMAGDTFDLESIMETYISRMASNDSSESSKKRKKKEEKKEEEKKEDRK